eukprot:7641780-Prorocentrum_lima.AAC.1
MTSSLVGSEMCIRDSVLSRCRYRFRHQGSLSTLPANARAGGIGPFLFSPVSYTHLTLPTICSV